MSPSVVLCYVLPVVSVHVGLRATVVAGVLDGVRLLGRHHPLAVAEHVLQGKLVHVGEGSEVDVPGVVGPGPELDVAGLLVGRVPGTGWDEALIGTVGVELDGRDPVDDSVVLDDDFVGVVEDGVFPSTGSVGGLVVDGEVRSPDHVSGQHQTIHPLVLVRLPGQSEVLPGGPQPGVHLEVPLGVHLQVPWSKTNSNVEGMVSIVLGGTRLHWDGVFVVLGVLEQVVEEPLDGVTGARLGEGEAGEEREEAELHVWCSREMWGLGSRSKSFYV